MGEEVADEKKGAEGLSLRAPLRDRREGGCVAREGDELLPIGEVGAEPVVCSALNTPLAQPFKEDEMVDRIEGRAEVK